jgi:hypothetical protein
MTGPTSVVPRDVPASGAYGIRQRSGRGADLMYEIPIHRCLTTHSAAMRLATADYYAAVTY